jgi:hypothetical protein
MLRHLHPARRSKRESARSYRTSRGVGGRETNRQSVFGGRAGGLRCANKRCRIFRNFGHCGLPAWLRGRYPATDLAGSSGKSMGVVGAPDTADLSNVELSPDGKRVAVNRAVNGNQDIWLIDAARSVPTRLTLDAANDALPVWSPDGSRVVFTSNRKGVFNLY